MEFRLRFACNKSLCQSVSNMMRRYTVLSALAPLLVLGACSESESKDKQPKEPSRSASEEKSSSTKPKLAPQVPPAPTQSAAQMPPLPAAPEGHEGRHIFSTQLGGDRADAGRALALGSSGEIFVAGYFKGDGPFGQSPAADGADAYLVKLSSKGTRVEWAVQLGGPGDDAAEAVAVDKGGNAVVVGAMADTLVVGDGSLKSGGADDMFVARFAPDGRRLWVKRFGGLDVDAAHAVTVGHEGNYYVTGVIRNRVEFGETTLQSVGDADICLFKLSPDGALLWVKQYGALGPDYGRDVHVDSQGNLLLLAEISREVSFGGSALQARGNRDIAVAKLSPEGNHIWSMRQGENYDDIAIGLTSDPAGSVLITGSFEGRISLGGPEFKAAGRSDAFVAKYDSSGQHLWSKSFGSDDEEWGNAIAADAYGNTFVTGWFWKEVDFGGHKLRSKGREDIFLLKLSPEGSVLWAKAFGNKSLDKGKAVAVNPEGHVYTVGTFHHAVNFGGDDLVPNVATEALVTAGDIYIAAFTP